MLKRAARTLLHSLRVIDAFRRVNRSGLRILMYHHFSADVENLKKQCEHIRRFYNPVTLDEVVAGNALPPNSIAITIDDGYRNFLHAHPVFREFEIPATVYLVSDFIDAKSWLWWDIVGFAVKSPEAVWEHLKSVPNEERLKAIASIDVPVQPPQHIAPLTWDEVRALASDGVTFGAHTKTHPILSRVSDDQARDEITSSKARIEAELGRPVKHFCYPNGRYSDFNSAAVDCIAANGFQTAVTAQPGFNFPGARPFLLNRVGAEPGTPMPYFAELLAGVRLQ